jgi:hypothetical protein
MGSFLGVMDKPAQNIQDSLNNARKDKIVLTIYLIFESSSPGIEF